MNSNSVIVGMADLNSIKDNGTLITLGLGSCVGIALYDPVAKVAGLAHAMLPNSKEIQNNSNIAKFVDLATIKLTKDMILKGAKQDRIVAKIAGGAQMFAIGSTQTNMRIGDRNVAATENMLRRLGIKVLAKDVGKTFGRTVELHAADGKFVIKTIEHGTYTI
ncbi:MAG: chemotaxis protein CheD [Eubacteriales bacterium]|nr:chemotaxis protein CheD [Eubacteriales bacterium]